MRLWLARATSRTSGPTATPCRAVPNEISLEAHQNAADYSSAKTALGIAAIVFDAAVLLVLTFGGGLQAIDKLAASFFPRASRAASLFVALLVVIRR